MVKYWVASHITGFFTIHDSHANPLYRGSRGAGFSIARGTTTTVDYSDDNKNHFFFNSEEVNEDIANVSKHVLTQYLTHIKSYTEIDFGVSVYHDFEVPLSCGFGASASGALGCSFALNELFDTELDEKTLYGYAHIAEIEEGGGLGDILSLYQGGWEYRIKEGSPFIGQAKNIVQNGYKVATLNFGDISTKSIIKSKEWKEKINSVGNHFVECIINKPTISTFAKMSQEFSLGTLLITPEIIEFIEKYQNPNLLIGQIMLGNGIFILYKQKSDLPKIESIVEEEVSFKSIKKI